MRDELPVASLVCARLRLLISAYDHSAAGSFTTGPSFQRVMSAGTRTVCCADCRVVSASHIAQIKVS
jgi:hypothetical protein